MRSLAIVIPLALASLLGPAQAGGDEREDAQCASGCKTPGKKYVKPLQEGQFEALLRSFGGEPVQSGSKALEELLFHHHEVRHRLSEPGNPAETLLDAERRRRLSQEVSRTHAWIAFRVLDGQGRVRLEVAPTLVPLGEKQHLAPTRRVDMQTADFNGTVVRTGLDHLWTRY